MPRTKVTFATCNLYNLNEPGERMYRDANGWSQEEYDKKIEWTSRNLAELDADVWGFQELWNARSLRRVFSAAGLGNSHTLLAPPRHRGRIVCAAAVRSDILVGQARWIDDFPAAFELSSGGDDAQTSGISVEIDNFSRPVLNFEIRPRANGKRIQVYVCHFKSKLPTKINREPWYRRAAHAQHSEALGAAIATIRRTAEAAALRMILTQIMKGTDTPVVVMGDLNDGQHSNTLNIVTGQPNYLVGLSTGGADADLYSVGALQEYRSERDVYYTHVHNSHRESLDHILVSQEFYDNSRRRLWAFCGMDIRNDHLNTDEHKQDGTSDHGIVRATFEYRPAR